MQNNVTELTQKLLRSLDSTYNVIDMAAVIEIVSLLEKVTITKELLETTRLGKYLNELRRKTANDSLSKRAKELLKKWRNMVLPEPPNNGPTTVPQAVSNKTTLPSVSTTTTAMASIVTTTTSSTSSSSGGTATDCTVTASTTTIIVDDALKKRPRSATDLVHQHQNDSTSKKFKSSSNNGQIITTSSNSIDHFDLSDNNSNSQQLPPISSGAGVVDPIIMINSDSNSSFVPEPQQQQTVLAVAAAAAPAVVKKRGRKKGSKNHKNLLDEAESSFTNKLAATRHGTSKVKTTQELLASLQSKQQQQNHHQSGAPGAPGAVTPTKNKEDLTLRAAKLTERVSIIDQKLNTNANRYGKQQGPPPGGPGGGSGGTQRRKSYASINHNHKFIESSGSVINDKNLKNHRGHHRNHLRINNNHYQDNNNYDDDAEDDIVIVDEDVIVGGDGDGDGVVNENLETDNSNRILSLSVEDALAQLPPLCRSRCDDVADDDDDVIDELSSKTTSTTKKFSCLCTCQLIEHDDVVPAAPSEFSILGGDGDDEEQQKVLQQPHHQRFEVIEDDNCAAKVYLNRKYNLFLNNHGDGDGDCDKRVEQLHNECIPNVNGNYGFISDNYYSHVVGDQTSGGVGDGDALDDNGLYVNVVPNVNNETISKKSNFSGENYKKYCISKCDNNEVVVGVGDCADNVVDLAQQQRTQTTTTTTIITNPNDNNKIDNSSDSDNKGVTTKVEVFREWHQVVDKPSYNGEILKILPYVIID